METEIEDLDLERELPQEEYAIGDNVVYPHHGAGKVLKKEQKEVLGEKREYLTIKILHNDMTVMVPCENAARAGLRRVIDDEAVAKVTAVLCDDVSQMPKNWNRRFKHNRDKIKTGDVYELAEVVRNLAAIRVYGLVVLLAWRRLCQDRSSTFPLRAVRNWGRRRCPGRPSTSASRTKRCSPRPMGPQQCPMCTQPSLLRGPL